MRLRLRGHRRPRPAPALPPPPDDLELANRAPDDESFITGNGIARRCRYVLNYGPPLRNEAGREGWYFCKTDALDWFFEHDAPRSDFVLFSHNSDYPVGQAHGRYLRRRGLRAWFAANVDLLHPKLHPLPLGIANPRWPHGNTDVLRRIRDAELPKTELFDVSFAIETNPVERRHCVERTGLAPLPPRGFEEYLAGLASSWFCISPRGNGVDTHRIWEALYLRTVPIVTRSLLTDHHRDLPIVVLDDWSSFRASDFTPKLYERLMGSWTPDAIRLDRYLERVERLLCGT